MPEGPVADESARDERAPDFFERTTPVLPELHWAGAAIQAGRFDELVERFPRPEDAVRTTLEHVYGTADAAVPLAEIRERFDRLAEQARWDPDLFLHTVAGLPGSHEDGLPEPPADPPDFEGLDRTRRYLALLEEMTATVELPFDRRHVIQLGPELLHLARSTGYTLMDVQTLRKAMHTAEPSYEGDGASAWEYLRLGEVDGARSAVEGVFKGIGFDVMNPFFAGPRTHISTTRLEALFKGDTEALGERTAARMRNHITGCKGCDRSWRYYEEQAARDEALRQGRLRRDRPYY